MAYTHTHTHTLYLTHEMNVTTKRYSMRFSFVCLPVNNSTHTNVKRNYTIVCKLFYLCSNRAKKKNIEPILIPSKHTTLVHVQRKSEGKTNTHTHIFPKTTVVAEYTLPFGGWCHHSNGYVPFEDIWIHIYIQLHVYSDIVCPIVKK